MVVMKHGQHLRAAARMLHERIYPQLEVGARPVHLLVLDDEADDGSILDAVVESDMDPTQDALKQIPRHVVDLWSPRGQAPLTASPHLYATYVGYTATPQANFLQADQNPLAPRDFIAALRTPFESGELQPRSTTFREPSGVTRYYTGGEVFYRRLMGSAGLVVSQDSLSAPEAQQDLEGRRRWISDAVRAYLVAGAIRLWRDPGQRRLSNLHDSTFATADEAKNACPEPHTMLFHPSSAVSDHFSATAELLAWAGNMTHEAAHHAVESGCRRLPSDALTREIDDHEALWMSWLERYGKTAEAVGTAFSLEAWPVVPGKEMWAEIRELLVNDVIRNVRLGIVNSDPDADDRPEFEPQQVDGAWQAPKDVFTIIISGNVMARGLTLQGLTTTLFLRSSGNPAADTQMQMQRWFGYRGSFLELCRVFLPVEQSRLFQQYHETDEALRQQIVEAMNSSGATAPSPLVIEGARFRATGKIADVSKIPLCPGATPFIDVVQDGLEPDPNVALLTEVFQAPSVDLVVNRNLRGRILASPVGLAAAASVLDRLRYRSYVPDPDDPTSQRWSAIEAQIGLRNDVVQSLVPLFRPPAKGTKGEVQAVLPSHCPYNIAAYLRLWEACLNRRARGLFPTDDGERPWALLDLAERRVMQPRLYLGIRYGSADLVGAPSDDGLDSMPFTIRPTRRTIEDGVVTATWGSRNPGAGPEAYLSDQLFDYHYHQLPVPAAVEGGPLWRPVGAPGLILFHLVRAEGRPYPVVAVGVALPLGGPDHFAARPRR